MNRNLLTSNNGQWRQRLSEGWRELRQKARGALTAFRPGKDESDLPVRSANRWGLLPVEMEALDDEILVRIEAPGLDRDNIHVEVLGETLVISGEKRTENTRRDGNTVWSECAYGHFERRLPLPCEVDSSRAGARYRRGVLTLRLPRMEHARRIKIEAR